MSEAQLIVLGMPLDENQRLSIELKIALCSANIIVGESRKIAHRYLKQAEIREETTDLFFLDNISDHDWHTLKQQLINLFVRGGRAVLFSDMGMPALFDTGRNVIEFCRNKGFRIRCIPGPTSWGTACALSLLPPPFYILGFLPRNLDERKAELTRLSRLEAHTVLMDTPYRFRNILKEAILGYGPLRHAFLAWEVGLSQENYFWGTLGLLEKETARLGLHKGEFVLIVTRLSYERPKAS